MFLWRTVVLAFLVFISSVCLAQVDSASMPDEDSVWAQELAVGIRLATAKKPNEALEYFEKVVAAYEERYKNSNARIMSARWNVESLMYVLEAANEKKGDTKVVSGNYGYAYHLKTYSLLELGRVSEAKVSIQRAIELSPRNSLFLSELGNIYQREKNWPMALQTFQSAEASAREFSPPNVKNQELSVAWRGIGYVFVEQGRIEEAEALYRKCLELDKNDRRALNELRYLETLKSKKGGA